MGHDATRYLIEIKRRIRFEVAEQYQLAQIDVARLGIGLVI